MEKNKNIGNVYDEDEPLSEMAPNLYQIRQSNDFIIPEGYFDSLPEKITNQIIAQPKFGKSLFDLTKVFQIKPIAITAFSITILVVFFVFIFNNFDESNKNNTFLTNNEVLEIDSVVYWLDMDENQIAEIMYINNKNATLVSSNSDITGDEKINLNGEKTVLYDDIVDFLIDENVDENDLLAVN